MPENFTVSYTHPSGATAMFTRQGGELDALAKGLDSEQFWVFKNVKALLARNDADDLREANRLMANIGFTAQVQEITRPEPAEARVARMREEALAGAALAPAAGAHGVELHVGPHAPQPSYWPLLLAISCCIALGGMMIVDITPVVTALGLIGVLFCIVRWGTEAFHVEL